MHLLLLATLTGCGGAGYGYAGRSIYNYVPLDDARYWEYGTEDANVNWILRVDKVMPTQQVGSMEVVTLEYSVKEPTELLYSINWSSDSSTVVTATSISGPLGSSTIFLSRIITGLLSSSSALESVLGSPGE